MRAIRISTLGDASVLELQNIPKPSPKAGEALIRLYAAGVNFSDIYMRIGRRKMQLPFIPGSEGAGIVEAVGTGVTDVKPGDRVAYSMHVGSYAEYSVVPAWQLIPLPDDISFELGAAFPLQGMTAHYVLHDYYRIKPGDTVLVHAAAGGVGLLLVQMLKHMQARVIGTVSTAEKAKIAAAAGADHIINYKESDFVTETLRLTDNKGVDYIADGVGKDTFTKDLDAVRLRGVICLFGSASGPAEPLQPNILQDKSLTICGGRLNNHILTRRELLERSAYIFKGMQEGWLKFKIDHIIPLEQAAHAQQLLESRQTTGKVILKIN